MENDVVCYEAQFPILFVEFMHGLPLINSGCRCCIDYLVQCKIFGEAHFIGVKIVEQGCTSNKLVLHSDAR
ncbi:hypothetical protein CMV_015843 [Castanea mollissima]|uniref:Uncharacterized protein n=1 Tax=Castanea mollissima TaxID=60419 RepID=A0A8J4VSY9_9ROSI|nr:hypothetical protein CMV_015843 [Castanea mollissima]